MPSSNPGEPFLPLLERLTVWRAFRKASDPHTRIVLLWQAFRKASDPHITRILFVVRRKSGDAKTILSTTGSDHTGTKYTVCYYANCGYGYIPRLGNTNSIALLAFLKPRESPAVAHTALLSNHGCLDGPLRCSETFLSGLVGRGVQCGCAGHTSKLCECLDLVACPVWDRSNGLSEDL